MTRLKASQSDAPLLSGLVYVINYSVPLFNFFLEKLFVLELSNEIHPLNFPSQAGSHVMKNGMQLNFFHLLLVILLKCKKYRNLNIFLVTLQTISSRRS